LTDEESRLVELRAAVSRAIRRRREERRLTQKDVARLLKTSQPRVNRIEAGASDVSLDLMFRELFALGGGLSDMVESVGAARRPSRRKASKAGSV
jgi:transcriptional regulator with XRE-family HTH domain